MLFFFKYYFFFFFFFFFFNDTATTEIYTLSLHDALPISPGPWKIARSGICQFDAAGAADGATAGAWSAGADAAGATAAAGTCTWCPPLAAGTGSSGTISSATMLMILISGLTAGPAVSL